MIINAHTTSCQLHQRSITSAVHYNRIYSTFYCQELTILGSLINPCTYARAVELAAR